MSFTTVLILHGGHPTRGLACRTSLVSFTTCLNIAAWLPTQTLLAVLSGCISVTAMAALQAAAAPNGGAGGPPAQASEQRREEAAALADITGFVATLQNSPGVSLAAELPEELLAALAALRALAARCSKAARKAAAAPEAAAQHRCVAPSKLLSTAS